MKSTMTRILAINVISWILVALTPLYAGGARAASRVLSGPPPRVIVRPPAVRPQQELSFWGVRTNLQQNRDELQPMAPRHLRKRSRLPKSAHRKQ
jgi:hypothetical protein